MAAALDSSRSSLVYDDPLSVKAVYTSLSTRVSHVIR